MSVVFSGKKDLLYLFTWALIFLMGVAPPDPVDLEPVDSDLKHLDTVMLSIFPFFVFVFKNPFYQNKNSVHKNKNKS